MENLERLPEVFLVRVQITSGSDQKIQLPTISVAEPVDQLIGSGKTLKYIQGNLIWKKCFFLFCLLHMLCSNGAGAGPKFTGSSSSHKGPAPAPQHCQL